MSGLRGSRSPSPSREREEAQASGSRSPSPPRGGEEAQASGGKAEAREVKDFSAEEFAEWLRRECTENDGRVRLNRKSMTDESLARLAEGLQIAFFGSPGGERDDDGGDDDDSSSLSLKKLILYLNDFGDAGLGALAEVLSRLPRCRETLEVLEIDLNPNVTTLAPLAAAGVLEDLKQLSASGCSLSGDEGVLPPGLCANLPALELLSLSYNNGGVTVTLTAEALRVLPAECKVALGGSKVQVARPSAEDGEMGLVALPTAGGEEFGGITPSSVKTVAEICAFAGVQRVTLVKPARA